MVRGGQTFKIHLKRKRLHWQKTAAQMEGLKIKPLAGLCLCRTRLAERRY
jgi:hypothetical protein